MKIMVSKKTKQNWDKFIDSVEVVWNIIKKVLLVIGIALFVFFVSSIDFWVDLLVESMPSWLVCILSGITFIGLMIICARFLFSFLEKVGE